jgi:hypothetical protein
VALSRAIAAQHFIFLLRMLRRLAILCFHICIRHPELVEQVSTETFSANVRDAPPPEHRQMILQYSRVDGDRVVVFLLQSHNVNVNTIQMLIHCECNASGVVVERIDHRPTRLSGLDCLEVVLKPGRQVHWATEGPKVAEALTLLYLITHAPDKRDGRALVDRLGAVCRTSAIAAVAKGWLEQWFEDLRGDPSVTLGVTTKADALLWFIAERISVLDRRFPGLLGARLHNPVPPYPMFMAA